MTTSTSLMIPAKKVTSFLARTAGLAGMAAIIYDSHKCAQADAKTREYLESTDILIKHYNNSMISNSRSTILCKLQDEVLNMRLSSGIYGFMANIKGYIGGFSQNVFANAAAMGLSAGALFLKKGNKLCAAGLAVVALKTLIYDVWGIGKSPKRPV